MHDFHEWICSSHTVKILVEISSEYFWNVFSLLFSGLVETDPEGALSGFSEVVRMEPDKADWWAIHI